MSFLLLCWLAATLPEARPPALPKAEAGTELDRGLKAFQSARDLYLRGEVEAAQRAFERVVYGAQITGDDDLWAQAMTFLGEIAYLDGDRPEADRIFRRVAQTVPSWRPSPYDHPDEVVGAYEIARTAVSELISPAEADGPFAPKALPWWGYAPLGVPQFRQQRPVRGALYATLQVGAAAASVGAWIAIDRQLQGFEQRSEPEQRLRRDRAVLLRDAWSIPAASTFYVAWAASMIDGGLSWRRDQMNGPRVAVTPQWGGGNLRVTWLLGPRSKPQRCGGRPDVTGLVREC